MILKMVIPSITALMTAVQQGDSKIFQKQLIARTSPVDDHASNGAAESIAGWTPTPGCRACDEESIGVKRRGRPYNHTPECSERQAIFREQLRQKKMLSAGEAPLVLEPVIGPVLPWPGTSENAKASSSYGCST